MAVPAITINESALLLGTSTSVSVGDVIIDDSTGAGYVVSTTANRGARRSHGVALSAWSSTVQGSVRLQTGGLIDATTTNLGTGAVSWVRCSAAGRLERCTPGVGDDLVGKCDANGVLFLDPGKWDSTNYTAASVTVPTTVNGVVTTNGTAFQQAANVLAGAGYISVGATPATVGAMRFTLGEGAYSRSSTATDVPLIRLSISGPDRVVVGGANGLDTGHVGDVHYWHNGSGATNYAILDSTAFKIATGIGFWIADSAGGQNYKVLVSNLAADRNVTLPLLAADDTFVFQTFAQTLTNKTIANAVSISFGATPSATEAIMLSTGSKAAIRNGANTGDIVLVGLTSDNIHLGNRTNAFQGDIIANIVTGGAFRVESQAAQNYIIEASTSLVRCGMPVVGHTSQSSPYGVHGFVTFAFAADANYVVTAAQYALDQIKFTTGAITAGRTVTFPAPATDAASYEKTVWNGTTQTLTISNGGTTKTLTTGLAQRFLFQSGGVNFASATWTP